MTRTLSKFRPYDVGELGEKWNFVSDHLPIGVLIGDFRALSWNVLNEQYMHYIKENGQGLNGSLITQLHGVMASKGLNLREEIIFKELMLLMDDRYPRSIIALQEVSNNLSKCLWKYRPKDWEILSPAATKQREQIVLYKKNIFEFVDCTYSIYDKKSAKVVFILTLLEKNSGTHFRFIQSHIPTTEKGPEKFVKEVAAHFDPHLTTILMGDLNTDPHNIQDVLEKESLPFHPLLTSYPTHINRHRQACWYDAFFVYNPNKIHTMSDEANTYFEDTSVSLHHKNITVSGVESMASLLQLKLPRSTL
jgi:hypothetical protein